MRCLPFGSRALLVLVEGDAQARRLASLVRDLVRSDANLPSPMDVVPAAESVLIDGLFSRRALEAWRTAIEQLPPDGLTIERQAGAPSQVVTVPVRYDGEDLETVAAAWECSVDAVAERHAGATFEVAFCGFAPGFAYCRSTPPLPPVGRRGTPRTRVPGGSVALGGEYSAVYPLDMPGGWQLIGSTTIRVFDPTLQQPALLAPGTLVRFERAT